ncbi:MAG: class I SAM-dependent methyltransferase [Peptococcaceae bacterium]|nr:class I SAM-dependent methyltransferase [Peptococcaceae bacterium]
MAHHRPARSRRLDALADILPPTDSLADVGTDHGGLLIALVLAGKIQKGIGIEIAEGPFRAASDHVADSDCGKQIEIRLGNGLNPVAQGEVTACAIAGLGGKTIIDILEASPDTTAGLDWLLLQPMTGLKKVRLHLQRTGWAIWDEKLVEERGILYTILLAMRGEPAPLSDVEAEFGPILLAKKPPLLEKDIRQRIQGLQKITDQLEQSAQSASQEKKGCFYKQIQEWEALYHVLYLS